MDIYEKSIKALKDSFAGKTDKKLEVEYLNIQNGIGPTIEEVIGKCFEVGDIVYVPEGHNVFKTKIIGITDIGDMELVGLSKLGVLYTEDEVYRSAEECVTSLICEGV